jgi:hypothetical protein
MKKLIVIVLLTVLGSFLAAQNVNTFSKDYTMMYVSVGNSTNIAYGLLELNGGYVVYGIVRDSLYPYPTRIYLMKIDTLGNTTWSKSYGKHGYNYNLFLPDGGGGIVNAPLGGYMAVGYISDSTNSWYKKMLFRFDGNGDTLWSRTYNDSASIEGYYIKVGRRNRYIIGSAWSDYHPHIPNFTSVLTETDTLGNVIWQKNYHSYSHLVSVDTCKDGGFVFSEWWYDTLTNCNDKIVITKVDSLGNQQWVKYITNGYCNAQAGAVISLKEGGYVICGSQDTHYPAGLSNPDPILYMAKLDNGGNIVWHNTYGVAGGLEGNNYFYSVKELPNGDLIACGDDADSSSSNDACIIKIDSLGNQKWLRLYGKLSPNPDYLLNILPTADGGYVSCGYIYSSPSYSWVIKVDSNGCDTIGCRDTVTAITEIQNKIEGLKVFPNPASTKLTVEYPANNEQLQFALYDIIGNQVKEVELPKGENMATIDLSNIAVGMYLYVLTNNNYIMQRGKLMIAR